jgi:hypothetical protein
VRGEVEVAARRDAEQLLSPEGEGELEVGAGARVVGQLVGRVHLEGFAIGEGSRFAKRSIKKKFKKIKLKKVRAGQSLEKYETERQVLSRSSSRRTPHKGRGKKSVARASELSEFSYPNI